MASLQASFAELARGGGRAALVTAVRGRHAGRRLLVRADGSSEGSLGDAGLDEQALADAGELIWAERSELRGELFVDITAPGPRVLIFGAVAYANHLAHLARTTGWRPYVIDPRSRFATRERLPDAIEVIVAWPERAVAQLGGIDPATYLAVLSNDPKIDDEILRLALSAAPAYIGAMGSRHAQAERRERLLAAGYGAYIAVVDIDAETGHVRIRRFVAVDDCGVRINPMVVEGQIHGGLAEGVGIALMEVITFDEEGNCLNSSFMDYLIPTALECPDFELGETVTPCPHHPLGAKGVGESPNVGSPPAIVNAVIDALHETHGVDQLDMPCTPARVWAAMQGRPEPPQ